LVVGLDGAGFDVIGTLIEQGRLPTLARIQREGISVALTSTYPPVSPIAWPSFCTGVGPGKHGVFGFQCYHPETYSQTLVSSRSVRAPSMWDILGQHGGETIAFNVPVTYPPHPIRGAMVTGMLTPDERSEWTYPAELKHELESAVGRRAAAPTRRMLRTARPSAAIERLRAHAEHELRLFLHLLRTRPWKLAIIVFRTPDVTQHAFLVDAAAGQQPPYELRGEGGRVIAEHYGCLDGLLAELIAAVPRGTATLVMSDHGAAVVHRCFRTNEWLATHGYLAWSRLPRFRQATSLWRRRTFGRQLKALRVQFLAPLFPRRWLDREVATPRWAQLLHLCRGPDWSRTRAYTCPTMREGIRVNLKGREAHGTVTPGDEYEALRDEIIAGLETLTDPDTGRRVAERVVRREDMYPGDMVDGAPDLIVVYPDHTYLPSSEPRRGQVFRSSKGLQAAQHSIKGILIGIGPGLSASPAVDASILDLAPTILGLLGVPLPAHLDGRVLEEALTPDVVADISRESLPAPAYQRPEAVEDEEAHPEVLRRLRDLGYIE
ncbi:MAG: alkaline phosphatase family protein, partial [Armatimonadota bacterium]